MLNILVLKKSILAVIAAGTLAATMTACGGDDKSDLYHSGNAPGKSPDDPPGTYIKQVDALIDDAVSGKLSASQFEQQVADVYCAAERAYGEQSDKLFQVVQTPNDSVGQVYGNKIYAEGYDYPEKMGWLTDMISQVGFHVSTGSPITSSFCIVAKGGGLPSAKVKRDSGYHPGPGQSSIAPDNVDDNTLAQQLKDGYKSATQMSDIVGTELRVVCAIEKRYGLDQTPIDPDQNPAFKSDRDRVLAEGVNDATAYARAIPDDKSRMTEDQYDAINQYRYDHTMTACQASSHF